MKRYVLLVLISLAISLYGCAAPKTSIKPKISKAFGRSEFIVAEIPSHGLIGDGLAIAVGGGHNTEILRQALLLLAAEGGEQYIAVIGSNHTLTKVVLINAVKEIPDNALQHLHIAFLGDQSAGAELKPAVKRTGAELVIVSL
ncbi:hypothetical protein [Geothermobacter hydrogeniphilus]|nr:hypothetical protein [Geothermobacter hydrogeniphilus]